MLTCFSGTKSAEVQQEGHSQLQPGDTSPRNPAEASWELLPPWNPPVSECNPHTAGTFAVISKVQCSFFLRLISPTSLGLQMMHLEIDFMWFEGQQARILRGI